MKMVLFSLIFFAVILGSTIGLAFAEVDVPKKIFQNQELVVKVTNAKSQYVTAVFYDLPAKNPDTKYREVSSKGSTTLVHSTKTLTLPSSYNVGPPYYGAAIKTVVYVDGEKFEFLTKIINSIR